VIPGFEDSPERPLRSPFTENSGSFLALRPHHYPNLLEANGSRKRKVSSIPKMSLHSAFSLNLHFLQDLTREQIEHNQSVIALSNEIDAPPPPPKHDKSVDARFIPSPRRRKSELKSARHVSKTGDLYFAPADLALEDKRSVPLVPVKSRSEFRRIYRREVQVHEVNNFLLSWSTLWLTN